MATHFGRDVQVLALQEVVAIAAGCVPLVRVDLEDRRRGGECVSVSGREAGRQLGRPGDDGRADLRAGETREPQPVHGDHATDVEAEVVDLAVVDGIADAHDARAERWQRRIEEGGSHR